MYAYRHNNNHIYIRLLYLCAYVEHLFIITYMTIHATEQRPQPHIYAVRKYNLMGLCDYCTK